MTKDVMISVRGLQVMGEDGEDSVETVQQGEYYQKNGTHFLIYDEYLEGFREPVKNVLRYKPNELSLTKRGLLNVQMLFETGKKNLASYRTPFGTMMIGMDTSRVEGRFEEHAFFLDVEYTLENNYQYLADCHISIEVREKGTQQLALFDENMGEARDFVGS